MFTADCKIVIRLADGNATLFFVDALIASKESTISNWTHSFGSPSFGLHANRVFLDEIASGDRKWRGEGVVDDWDGDGVPNPYDWTPTSITVSEVVIGINLTLDLSGEGGTKTNPWPIYNVWQLQAISSISMSTEGAMSVGLTLFGDGDNLTAHYRLAADVDATPTRGWNNDGGFTPIGVFVGSLDGEGREIRGLYVNLNVDGGLFHTIGDGGRVSRLGLPDVEIRTGGFRRSKAAVAHDLRGAVSLVWATGEIVADDGFVGGLARNVAAGGQIRESWFVGKVRGLDNTGGLVGNGLGGEVQDSWAVARVEWSGTNSANANIGGLVGISNGDFALNQSWSGGWLDTDADERALIGGTPGGNNYFDRSISRASVAVHNAVLTVDTIVTVTNSAWSTMAWNFGDMTLSDDNAADYPFLRGIEDLWPGLQAVAFADFQTRILSVAGGVELPSEGRTLLGIEESITLTLDTNGLATVAAPTPTCAAEATIAMANYNDVTVRLRTTNDGSAEFTADCEIVIRFADSDSISRGNFSLDVLIASKEATISKWSHSFDLQANRIFLDEIAAGDRQWRGVGDADDWDGDGIANPYDWTPISITVGEAVIGVNLTVGLTGEGGTKDNPWPIYNVWQLQAIDGVSVSHAGVTVRGLTLTLFGADQSERLGAQYRLMENIDATPTKEWKDNAGNTVGFDPIGDVFSDPFAGFFDGGGYAVRGLFISRTTDIFTDQRGNNVGLFAQIRKAGELAVSNLGVEDADIRGGTGVGIIAGSLSDASVGRVWTTGKVFGLINVGGLVGEFYSSDGNSAITMSWSTANVGGGGDNGGNNIGGLTGKNGVGEDATRKLTFDDNWAAGNVSGNERVAGFSGLASRVSYARNWSSGEVSGANRASAGGFVGGKASGVSYDSSYWNLDTSGVTISGGDSATLSVVVQTLAASNFGGESAAAAWAFADGDFPLLTVHSRPWQAVNLARALTRILAVGDATIVAAAGTTITTTDAVRLDTNGLATDTETGGTSIPNCSFNNTSRVLGAQTNYNGVSVKLSLMTSESGVFIDSTDKIAKLSSKARMTSMTSSRRLCGWRFPRPRSAVIPRAV